jgi:pimeloyl-ACP methyl ester carboxylesterase
MAALVIVFEFITPEQWRVSGETFNHDGREIFFRLDGDGPPLVLLHGFPTSSWDWHKIWPALTSRFRVLAADFLGFGFSDKPRDCSYSLLAQTDLIVAVTEHIGFRRFDLLAHDYGVSVAQELLARDFERRNADLPALLKSVCFLNGGLFPESHRARPIQRLLLSPLGPLLARAFSRDAFKRSFSPVFGPDTAPTEEEFDAYWSLIERRGGNHISHKLLRYMPERKRQRARWTRALQRAHCPLRLINGSADPVSGKHLASRYRELIPGPDVVALADTGHYPQMEAPQAVVKAFFEFLDVPGDPTP